MYFLSCINMLSYIIYIYLYIYRMSVDKRLDEVGKLSFNKEKQALGVRAPPGVSISSQSSHFRRDAV